MKVTRFSIRHPITTLMFFCAVFLLGMVSLSRLPLDLFPDISMPTVAIFTPYPGVGPFEVESGITKPIEEALSSLNGVENISSTSSEGISLTIVNFDWSADMDTVVSDIREQLNQIEDSLPEGAERSGIFKFNPQQLPSIVANIYTQTTGIDIRRLVEKEIVPTLEKIEGVARADLFGGSASAVLIRLNLDAIGKLRIPIMQLMQVFQGENIDLPAGAITIGERYVLLRTMGEFSSLEDIGLVLVGYRNGIPIFLKDVAEISIDKLLQEEYVRAGGFYGVAVSVRRQPGHNTVKINDSVKAALKDLEKRLPSSVNIQIRTDQSKSIIQSIGSVANAAWQGGLLAIVVLLFFLRNIRSTLIVAIVIPVSVIATFSLMDFGGLSMNMVSLMGITLGVGMFVDNSIVVLESNYRKQLAGLSPEEAADEGTAEVGKAITASTLTTVAVFIPMLFVQGMAGLIFDDLSLTISFALAVSLAVALTLIPLLCSKMLRVEVAGAVPNSRAIDDANSHRELSLADVEVHTGNKIIDAVSRRIQVWLRALDEFYEQAVNWALNHVLLVILTAVVLFLMSIGSVLLLGMEFLPETDEGEFSIYIETKTGVSYEVMIEKIVLMEDIIMDYLGSGVLSLSSLIGQGGDMIDAANVASNLATINVVLVDKDKRTSSIWEIINGLDQRFESELIDLKYRMVVEGIGSLAASAAGETDPVVVELAGDNLDDLYGYAKQVEAVMAEVDGIRTVSVSHKVGKPELQFIINRRDALSLGLSPLEIGVSIRTAYKGSTVTRFSTDEENYDVILILREQDRIPERFSSLFFVNNAGTRIPLENLVDIEEGSGPLGIKRKDRTRQITVTGSLTGERALNRVMNDLEKDMERISPPPLGIDLAYGGSSVQMAESYSSLFLALLFAIALVYMVMASQFESLLHPFIVMFSIPFAVIGLVAALLITGTTFSLLAFVGAILLVGIVVNNAIVLIDYINQLRKRGIPLREAIIQGGKTRLKPILMTTMTTVFALLPMSLGIGTGAEIRAPMGRAVVGGLITSTAVTLILIPVIYWLIESRLRRNKDEKLMAETVS